MKVFKPIFLFFFFSAISVESIAQCMVESTDGYTVTIELTPQEILAPDNCPFGYNYNVSIDYNITFDPVPPPGGLWDFQGFLFCGSDRHQFQLPRSGGQGTLNTVSNVWRPMTDCADATVESLSCNTIEVTIFGPGIPRQTIDCPPLEAALPVTLLDFNVREESGYASVTWRTASEHSNAMFEVQRSVDGLEWISRTEIKGQMYSDEITEYTFSDPLVNADKIYYRLRQIDYNGDVHYLGVASIDGLASYKSITVFPNPTRGMAYLSGVDDVESVSVYKWSGEEVTRTIPAYTGQGRLQFDFTHLPEGLYMISLGGQVQKLHVVH